MSLVGFQVECRAHAISGCSDRSLGIFVEEFGQVDGAMLPWSSPVVRELVGGRNPFGKSPRGQQYIKKHVLYKGCAPKFTRNRDWFIEPSPVIRDGASERISSTFYSTNRDARCIVVRFSLKKCSVSCRNGLCDAGHARYT